MQTNRSLYIDIEAVATLRLVQCGILAPVTTLMNKQESESVDSTGMYQGRSFPFSFLLAPKGRRNKEVLLSAEEGEVLDLICDGNKRGELTVGEVFRIDPIKRVQNIYSTTDMTHPGVKATLDRLGEYAISGDYWIEFEDVDRTISTILNTVREAGAKKVTGMVMAARPLHRAHERVIRQELENTDLIVIFLTKPYLQDEMPFQLRYKTLNHFVNNFLASHKVLVVPFENTYIFAGNNELILNAIALKNFGMNRFLLGQNHAGLGLHYDNHAHLHTIFDEIVGIDIEIKTVSEFVYCNECKTLVTTNTCPHGQHHHISYHSDSIMELIKHGILPPPILMRREISAMILAELFPNRFKNIPKLYYDFIPSTGLLEEHTEEDFYLSLMSLYQTTSLT